MESTAESANAVVGSAVVSTPETVSNSSKHLDSELDHLLGAIKSDLRGAIKQIIFHARGIIEQPVEQVSQDTRIHSAKILGIAGHLKDVIDDLNDATTFCRSDLEIEKIEVLALGKSVYEKLAEKQPHIRLRLQFATDAELMCDERLLSIFILHALKNADKFTHSVPEPMVELSVTEKEGKHVLTIKDNGPGFAPHHAARLFEPSERQNVDRDHPGAGVSLAIMRQVADRLGARVWCISSPGRGCTIAISIAH